AVARPARAQSDFQWRGHLNTGQTVEIRGINGDINASASSSGDVEVRATKTANRSNPADVRIEVVPGAGGVTICAVYPAPPGRGPNVCEPARDAQSSKDNDTQVAFDVRVPYGVAFRGKTVNGEVNAESLQSDVALTTVNGSIKATTTGNATASTVNGSVNVTMGRMDGPDAGSFRTVNGGITLHLTGAVDAEVRAETLNGSFTSDFPITFRGEITKHRVRGTIGNGGPELDLKTVNGSIKLLREQEDARMKKLSRPRLGQMGAAGALSRARPPAEQTPASTTYIGPLTGVTDGIEERRFDPVAYARDRYAAAPRRLRFQARTRSDAEAWQKSLRAKLSELVGGFPSERTPLRPVTLETRTFRNYRREKIVFDSRPGVSVLAYVLRPARATNPSPSLICIPGHGRGVDDIVGVDEQGRDRTERVGYEYDFAVQVADAGMTAIAIEPMA